ncbi:MAG TPA: MFS transporter [Candidatus Limnocylindria bacterium]|nr:MFS transporter [Candidatus Limnocylindria bacterium]
MRRGPFRHRWFNLFIASVGLGSVGGEVARLAMPLLVLDITHSLGAAALLRVTQMVPYVFFGALAGALIDRVDKRLLLIWCDLASAALMAAVPLSVTFGVFSLELLYAVSFLLGTVEVLWGVTTDFSVLPSLVEESELTTANAAYLGADRAARVAGPLLGGATIAALGGGVAADAAALWIAVAAFVPTLVVFLLMPPLLERSSVTASLTPANVAREIGEGFSFIWRSRILRALLLLMFLSNLGGVGIQTLLLFVLSVEHGLDAATIGLALSLTGVVTILGSLAAPLLARGRPVGQTMLGVVAVAALSSALAALARDWRLIVALVAARQTAWAAHIVYVYLPRQREVPAALRGRVNGSFRTIVLIANASSPALLSWVQAAAGSPAAFAVAGACMALSVGVTYFSPLRAYDIREPERRIADAEGPAETEPTAAD